MFNNRPLTKLINDEQVQGAYGAQNRNIFNISEDSSTGATPQLTSEIEFCKRSNIKNKLSIFYIFIIILLYANTCYSACNTFAVGSVDDNSYLNPKIEICQYQNVGIGCLKLSCTTADVNSLNGNRLITLPNMRFCSYKLNGQICVFGVSSLNSECPDKMDDQDVKAALENNSYDNLKKKQQDKKAADKATASGDTTVTPPAPAPAPEPKGSNYGCVSLPIAPSPPKFCQYIGDSLILSGAKVLTDDTSSFFDPRVIVEMSYGEQTPPFGPGTTASVADQQAEGTNRSFTAYYDPNSSYKICVKEGENYIGCANRPAPSTPPKVTANPDGNVLKFDIEFGAQSTTIYEISENGNVCSQLYGINFCALRMCGTYDTANPTVCKTLGDKVCVLGYEQFITGSTENSDIETVLTNAGFCSNSPLESFNIKNVGTYVSPKVEVNVGGTLLLLSPGSPTGKIKGITYSLVVTQDPTTEERKACVKSVSNFVFSGTANSIETKDAQCFTMAKPPAPKT